MENNLSEEQLMDQEMLPKWVKACCRSNITTLFVWKISDTDIYGSILKMYKDLNGQDAKIISFPESRELLFENVLVETNLGPKYDTKAINFPMYNTSCDEETAKKCDEECGSGLILIENFAYLNEWQQNFLIGLIKNNYEYLNFKLGSNWRIITISTKEKDDDKAKIYVPRYDFSIFYQLEI